MMTGQLATTQDRPAMSNRDLANATGLAEWIVANGYRPHMTRKMVLRLARTDPAAPQAVPSAGSETVYSLSQWRCYLDPTADPSQARQYLGTDADPDVVDGEEMARRVIAQGHASSISQVTVLRLARQDPDFPETLTAGDENQERLFSWTEAVPYWKGRAYRPSVSVAAGHLIAPSQPDAVGIAPEVVTATVAAQRLIDDGYVAVCNRRQLLELARRDPGFPASLPTSRTGQLWLWAGQLAPYFKAAAEPDLLHVEAIAEWVIRLGYGRTMTPRRVEWLAAHDPRWPKALTSGPSNKETLWSWALQLHPYFDPAAGPGLELDPTAGPALVNWRQVARRLVECGYAETMTPQRLYRLAARDPRFPRPIPSAGKEKLWWWHWQLVPYFFPEAEPDLVNARGAAARAVRAGYTTSMSRQRIRELSLLDPLFPKSLPSAGDKQLWSWNLQLEPYFRLVYDPRPRSWKFGFREPSQLGQRRSARGAPTGDRLGRLRIERLTAREVEVLQLAAAGESNTSIGRALRVAPATVESRLARIYVKLDVQDRAEAASLWLESKAAATP
jgi:DNA-binding CsgD family transcriptional regulator